MIKIGDKVQFGRPNGNKQFGVVQKVNHKSYIIASNDGVKWRTSHNLVQLAGDNVTAPKIAPVTVSPNKFRVDDMVFFGRPGGATAHGVIIKINRKRAKVQLVRPYNSHQSGTVFNVPFQMIRSK